ncbi:MAG: hypothetical protein SNJ69_14695 [Chloroflexaceae bacterium]
MECTTATDRGKMVVQQPTDRMAAVARSLRDRAQGEARPLAGDRSADGARSARPGQQRACGAPPPGVAPARSSPELPCPCGQTARYERMRGATVTAVLGRITVERARYACPHCGEPQAPLDQRLQVAAGGLSPGPKEALALLGTTRDSFAEASAASALRVIHGRCKAWVPVICYHQ